MLKIDWLSFTFIPTDDDIAQHNDILGAFFSYFPVFENVFGECAVFGSSKGRYYDNILAWNDNILISWDNTETERELQKDTLKAWQHGVNVCIPSHGLSQIFYLLGLATPVKDIVWNEYKEIYYHLKNRHCQISRLDIAYDDFTKTFTPKDFLVAWYNDEIQSSCNKMDFATSGKGGGETFYLGNRRNKLLRIYDKAKESHGEIDSIRYEIELHNRYANELSEMILNDNFDFISYFEKYFIILKKQNENRAHVKKSLNSRLENSELWEEWKKSSFANSKEITFPKHEKNVSMENKERWIKTTVLPSLVQYIRFVGLDNFLDMLSNIVLNPYQQKIVDDSIRIYDIVGLQKNPNYKINRRFSRCDIMRDISIEIAHAFN